MTAPPVLIWSHFRHGSQSPFQKHIDAGMLREVWESEMTEEDFEHAPAIMTTMHLDQIRAENWRSAFSRLLARGGRIAISGHIMRPFLDGLAPYRPAEKCGREGLKLAVLADHPVFDGIDRIYCGTRRGVAGFYGRGHNPMPQGGTALTSVGPARAPIDWVWNRPDGGSIFSHAGNDLWGVAEEPEITERLMDNLVHWLNGAIPTRS